MNKEIEKSFLVIALVFGLAFVFLIPPMQSPDEDSHYRKSVAISFGHLLAQGVHGSAVLQIPKGALDFVEAHRYLYGQMDQKYRYSQMIFANWLPADWGPTVDAQFSTSESHFILHLPQAAGMLCIRLLIRVTLGSAYYTPITAMYAGRLSNLIFYLMLLFYAIKLTPHFKHVFFIAGLLPTALYLAATESYDVFAFGGTLLLLAYIFYLIYDEHKKTIQYRDHLFLALISILLLVGKYIYFPVMILILFIPAAKYSSNKRKVTGILLTLTTAGVLFFLLNWINGILLKNASGPSYSSQQIAYVLSHPFEYIMIILRTIRNNSLFYLKTGLATFGVLDTNFPVILCLGLILFLFLMIIIDSIQSVTVPIGQRIVAIFTLIGIIVLIETALYIGWTALPQFGGVGAPLVNGVQGRYFLPLIPLLCVILSARLKDYKIVARVSRFAYRHYPSVSVFFLVASVATIVMRYWIG